MKDEAPFEAVRRVLKSQFNIEPNNVQTMMLIEAVQQASPPHPDATIASLRAILRSLSPDNGLESWAYKSAREITAWLSKQAEIREIATRADEGFWCTIEGTLTGMLLRVTRGQDLDGTAASKIKTTFFVELTEEDLRSITQKPIEKMAFSDDLDNGTTEETWVELKLSEFPEKLKTLTGKEDS
jgi:hypothetical protein